jgi:aromatic ring hydroxylase
VASLRRSPDRSSITLAQGSLAWDFVGSSLAGRNVLYERFYFTTATRNRINNHLRNVDKSRAGALVDGILAAGRKAPDR